MNDQIEACYPKIAQSLVDLLPDNFEDAFIRVEMIDDVWSVGIFYRKDNGRYGYLNQNIETLADNFQKLRTYFKVAGEEPFTTSTFRLSNSGKFSIDFGYEDVSDFGMAAERRKTWIKKYLGDNPQIDWQ